MKRILAATIVTTALLGFANAAMAEVTARTIRLGISLPKDSTQGVAAQFFADKVSELSDGKLKVRVFADGTLGSGEQMLGALVGGAQEAMVTSTGTIVTRAKEFAVFDFPFLFEDEAQADNVLEGEFGSYMLDLLKPRGVVGLAFWENGFRNVTTSSAPVERFSDLQGLKIRTIGNPVFVEMFQKFGANPVPMSFSELFTALETGAVDGQENPLPVIQSARFYEVQDHLTMTKHAYSPFVLLVSGVWWDSLSDEERSILSEAGALSRDVQLQHSRETDKKAAAFLSEHGMTIHEMPAAERQKMIKAARSVTEQFAPELPGEIWSRLQLAMGK